MANTAWEGGVHSQGARWGQWVENYQNNTSEERAKGGCFPADLTQREACEVSQGSDFSWGWGDEQRGTSSDVEGGVLTKST